MLMLHIASQDIGCNTSSGAQAIAWNVGAEVMILALFHSNGRRCNTHDGPAC